MTAATDTLETAEEREARVRAEWEKVQAAFAFKEGLLGTLNAVVVDDVDLQQRGARHRQNFVVAVALLSKLWGRDPLEVLPEESRATPA